MRFFLALPLTLTALLYAGALDAEARPVKKSARVAVAAEAPIPVPPVRNADGTLHTPNLDDAPADDYQRVAWCHGVLSGDMELAEIVSSVLPVDKDIQSIGASYLRAYEAALTLSGKGATPAKHLQADKARQVGYDAWATARVAPMKEAAFAYINWQLPGDCEHAAVRLSGHANLFAEMATDAELDATERALKSGGPHDYKELPKPVLTAQAAPVDPDAPIATNTLGRRAQQAVALPSVTASPAPAAVQPTPVEAPKTTPDATSTPAKKPSWSDGLMQRLGWGKK